jgi:hypothetical protein
VFTLFLTFHDGPWVTTRFEASWGPDGHLSNKAVRFLMLAIDEAAEK